MDEGIDKAYVPNTETWVEHTAPEPDFTARAADPAFGSKLKAVESALGGSAKESEQVSGLFLIEVNRGTAYSLIDLHERFYNDGIYIFDLIMYGGFGGPQVIGVLPTTDQFEVVRTVGTEGADYNMSNAYIIKHLRELHAKHPIVITGLNRDTIACRFKQQPGQDMELAKYIYAFCPGIVDLDRGSVEALADEIAEGSLYLRWGRARSSED